eukprot:667590-Rhodomonas_salina.3
MSAAPPNGARSAETKTDLRRSRGSVGRAQTAQCRACTPARSVLRDETEGQTAVRRSETCRDNRSVHASAPKRSVGFISHDPSVECTVSASASAHRGMIRLTAGQLFVIAI